MRLTKALNELKETRSIARRQFQRLSSKGNNPTVVMLKPRKDLSNDIAIVFDLNQGRSE